MFSVLVFALGVMFVVGVKAVFLNAHNEFQLFDP
jgi:hypothetical protein